MKKRRHKKPPTPLTDHRPTPNPEGFMQALASTNFPVAEQMLRQSPTLIDGDVYGSESALHFFAVESREDVVSWLLEKGADPNRQSEFSPPLVEAAGIGHTEVCRLLIEAGADVNAKNRTDTTPLISACRLGKLPIIELLIASGADVSPDSSGGEAWDEALPRKSKEIRALLEKHGGGPSPKEYWQL